MTWMTRLTLVEDPDDPDDPEDPEDPEAYIRRRAALVEVLRERLRD